MLTRSIFELICLGSRLLGANKMRGNKLIVTSQVLLTKMTLFWSIKDHFYVGLACLMAC